MPLVRVAVSLSFTLVLAACGSFVDPGADAGHGTGPDVIDEQLGVRDASAACPAPATITRGAPCATPSTLLCDSRIPAPGCAPPDTYVPCTCQSGAWSCFQRDPYTCPADAGVDASNACPSSPNDVQTGVACSALGQQCQGYSPCALTFVNCTCTQTGWDCGSCIDADAASACPSSGVTPFTPCATEGASCATYESCGGGPPFAVSCTCNAGTWQCPIVDCPAEIDSGVLDAASACPPGGVTDGTACASEGASCTTNASCGGDPFSVPCTCTSGTWFCEVPFCPAMPDSGAADASVDAACASDVVLDGSCVQCPADVTLGGACSVPGLQCFTPMCLGWGPAPCTCESGHWQCICEG